MENKIIGSAWIINGFRPIYNSIKKIKKGKNKGKLEVWYIKGKNLKKILIYKDDIKNIEEKVEILKEET